MKKYFFLLVLWSTAAFSQREEQLTDTFTKITSFDRIDVILIRTTETPKISINGKGSDDVEIVQKGFELKIRMKMAKLLQGDNISATVFYNKDVTQFEANEGSRIASSDYFKSPNMRFIAKEGGSIKLKIEADKINVKVGNGSAIVLSGVVKNQEIATNTGGMYEGANLLSNETIISSNTGGNASVHASDLVDAKILAGGVIKIYGDPKRVIQKVTGGGRVEVVE